MFTSWEDALFSAEAILYIWIVLVLIIAIHEFGHAFAGLALNEKVEGITIGFGSIFKFKFLDIPISIGLFPIGGMALVGDLGTPWQKRFIIAAAGPLATFMAAAVTYIILDGIAAIDYLVANLFFVKPILDALVHGQSMWLPQLLGVSSHDTALIEILLRASANLNLIFGVFNLLPIPVLDGGRMSFSLLRGIFGKKVEYIEAVLIPLSVIGLVAWFIYDAFR